MILRDQPSTLQLLLILRGSVVPFIVSEIVGVACLSLIALLLDKYIISLPHISIGAMGVFGVALSLFLGFRNNAAYARWWEARTLWGTILAEVRNLGRHMNVFVESGEDRAQVLSQAVAFTHLHRGFLRSVDVQADITGWVGAEKAAVLNSQGNGADAALRSISDDVARMSAGGNINGFGAMTISQSLSTIALAQAGCERIATTPLPFVYSLLVRRTTYIYCGLLPFALIESTGWLAPIFSVAVAYMFFGLQTVADDLEAPFRDVTNGLPLDALCRTIEISVSEALDRAPPQPLTPKNHVLA